MDWHSISYTKTAAELKTDIVNGLTSAEAAKRLKKYGRNVLTQKKQKGVLLKFFSQFSDFTVLILLAAAAVSFAAALIEENGDFIDPVMILLIVVTNAVIGTVQECRAEHAIDALKKLSAPHSHVIRNGRKISVPSEELVPGDIITVDTGDMVCADARLCESAVLKAEEAALTGESLPSEKQADILLNNQTQPADRKNMLYSSTYITSGHAKAIVTATAMNTQVGKIASMIDSEESPQTPLQKSLAKTGKTLGICALIICAVIFVLGLFQKIPPLDMFMISISLAVAAIPEGMPAVVTIVLALGVRKMALHRAIVRHLPAVETLGSANVICSDKTGTLTQNRMTVMHISSYNGKTASLSAEENFILTNAALCCNSKLIQSGKDFKADGDPTEAAIIIAAAKSGIRETSYSDQYRRAAEYPFDSERKLMTTVCKAKNGGFRIITKGAVDMLLPKCSHCRTASGNIAIASAKSRIIAENNTLANQAMRVIAVAYKDTSQPPESMEEAENNLIFCGLIGMIDPPRPQAKTAVAMCRKAGIKTVMITGDHIATAKAIAEQLGIYRSGDKAVTGAELDAITDSELRKHISSYSVFARVSPEHKMRIVKAFQHNGSVVAMTGDGVNDAPALRCADIGCSMGISGTDAAKNASDMILTDDNFSTIVEAVEQGRGIFENIRRTIHFLLSSNIGEILTVLSAFLMRLPSPLLAIQLLWINLVTDSLPALALGVEPTDPDIMDKAPLHSKKGIFGQQGIRNIIIEGCFIGALSFLAYTIGRVFFDAAGEPVTGRTMTFAVLSLSQLVHSFNLRSEHSLFKTGIFGNLKLVGAFAAGLIMQVSVISVPFLSSIFKTVPLSLSQWLIVFGLSLIPLIVAETEKKFSAGKSYQ